MNLKMVDPTTKQVIPITAQEYDRLLWRESFNSILKMKAYLRSGLNHTLSTKEMKLANMLYRKYC